MLGSINSTAAAITNIISMPCKLLFLQASIATFNSVTPPALAASVSNTAKSCILSLYFSPSSFFFYCVLISYSCVLICILFTFRLSWANPSIKRECLRHPLMSIVRTVKHVAHSPVPLFASFLDAAFSYRARYGIFDTVQPSSKS